MSRRGSGDVFPRATVALQSAADCSAPGASRRRPKQVRARSPARSLATCECVCLCELELAPRLKSGANFPFRQRHSNDVSSSTSTSLLLGISSFSCSSFVASPSGRRWSSSSSSPLLSSCWRHVHATRIRPGERASAREGAAEGFQLDGRLLRLELPSRVGDTRKSFLSACHK